MKKEILIVILSLLVISVGVYLYMSSNDMTNNTGLVANENKLGVSFILNGNKIDVVGEYDSNGQYNLNLNKSLDNELVIIKKDPGETFTDAVLRVIDSDSPYCKIEQPSRNKDILNKKGYESLWVVVDFKKYLSDTGKPADGFGGTECSDSGFVAGNWFSYFIYNPDVPDKIIFVDHGQDTIWSDYDARQTFETTLNIY